MLVSCCVRSGMISSIPSIVDCYLPYDAKREERETESASAIQRRRELLLEMMLLPVLLTDVVVGRVVWPCGWPTIWAALTSRRGRHHWTEPLKGDRPVGNPHPSLACGCSGYCYGGCYGGGGV